MIKAVLDACVLYPPSLRDLLMRIATEGVYEPYFTETIHDEWIRSVLSNNPNISFERLHGTRNLMNRITSDCLVSNFERHIPNIKLPDNNDRHVVAAAIEAQADVIVTFNLNDFPASEHVKHGVKAKHPDAFLSALFDSDRDLMLSAIANH